MDLRERISPEFREKRLRERNRQSEEERLWEQKRPILEYQDELDERHLAQGQSVRSAHNAQKRGIERYFKAMCDIDLKVAPPPDAETRWPGINLGESLYKATWGMLIQLHFMITTPPIQPRDKKQVRNRKDLRDNYLYAEWEKQLNSKYPIKTYATYSLYVGILASVRLLTEKANWGELVEGVPVELRDQVLRWKESEVWEPHSPYTTIGWGMLLPGLAQIAEALLVSYGDFVRAERERLDKEECDVVESPLPDDPYGNSLSDRYEIPENVRIDNAVQAYLAKEGSADTVAVRYKIPQKQFRQILRDRGLLAQRGGDRKGKQE